MRGIVRLALLIMLLAAAPAVAQTLPSLDVGRACRQAASLPGHMTTFERCMSDEGSAKDELAKGWSAYAAADRKSCGALAGLGGSASYVQLLECLNMARDARTMKTRP
jgi:hypothetical protein